MLPGLDAVPLKREFKRLMKRSVSATIALLFEANSSAEARATLGVRSDGERTAAAGGTANAITATFSSDVTLLTDGLRVRVTGLSRNTIINPTLAAGTTAATAIKSVEGFDLNVGEISAEEEFIYSSAQAAWLKQSKPQDSPFDLSASVAGNALTITLKKGGWYFRNATLGAGGFEYVKTDTDLALTISSGSTLGSVSGVQSDVLVRLVNDAGTLRLTAENIAGGMDASEMGVISTTAEGGAGGADSATVIYSGTAVTSKAYRVAGIVRSTQATAGTWATQPSLTQGAGGNALTAMQSLGYGQTWQTVTRTSGTTYYNTTGKPLQVQYNVGPSSALTFSIGGADPTGGSGVATPASTRISVVFTVPVGQSYGHTVSAGSVVVTEMR